ncbi:Cac2p [Sugiyamaella lignohabitans]|uniref:Cac2p n=1 Tax=Sugiyamaella lignohabitans TaxID=796027 RepID=A0A167ENW9_9ASCO|nr:Cac2p [Sugiyamaella lignohabitans]ANB14296.1 Cac2p [Sugiyamaella lignohabitans]
MKAKVLTVHWHQENQPIYSAHFQPIGPSINPPGHEYSARLATAGGDNNIRIWRLEYSQGVVKGVQYLATLAKHSQAVNVVRFDPKGTTLASASDDGTVLLWALQDSKTTAYANSKYDGTDESDLEVWKLRHACRGGGQSSSEVYDVAWSPDSQYIIAGQVNNVARIYNASNGQCIRELVEHSHYVQGVAWDPLNEYLATQSSDRSVHIYTLKTKDGKYTLNNPSYKISTPFKISRADLPTVRKNEVEGGSAEKANGTSSASTSIAGTATGTGSSVVATTPSSSNATHPPQSALTPNSSGSTIYPSASTPSAATNFSTSPPDTPRSTGSMNPPPQSASRTHSRKSSFSSLNRPESPSPAFPLPAVRQTGSPIIQPASLAGSFSGSTPFSLSTNSSTSPSIPMAQLATAGASPSGSSVGALSPAPTIPLIRSSMLYHNETFTSFFRRLTFSPDGSLLFTPSGLYKYSSRTASDGSITANCAEETTNTVYIYTRAGFNKPPVAHLPGLHKPSLAVKCSPILYKLRESPAQFAKTQKVTLKSDETEGATDTATAASAAEQNINDQSSHIDSPVFNLKYRVVYAVATQDAVIVYDTQQKHPLCIASNLHYATFTDLAWTPDGNTLLMTSTDGFCSTLSFEDGELGEVYVPPNQLLSESSTFASPKTPISTTTSDSLTPSATSHPTIPPSSPGKSTVHIHQSKITAGPTSSSNSTTSATYSAASPLPADPALIPVLSHVPSISVGSASRISKKPRPLPLKILEAPAAVAKIPEDLRKNPLFNAIHRPTVRKFQSRQKLQLQIAKEKQAARGHSVHPSTTTATKRSSFPKGPSALSAPGKKSFPATAPSRFSKEPVRNISSSDLGSTTNSLSSHKQKQKLGGKGSSQDLLSRVNSNGGNGESISKGPKTPPPFSSRVPAKNKPPRKSASAAANIDRGSYKSQSRSSHDNMDEDDEYDIVNDSYNGRGSNKSRKQYDEERSNEYSDKHRDSRKFQRQQPRQQSDDEDLIYKRNGSRGSSDTHGLPRSEGSGGNIQPPPPPQQEVFQSSLQSPQVLSIRYASKPPIVQVRNLAPGTTAEDLTTVLERVGPVQECRVRDTTNSVMAEVLFASGPDAESSQQQLDGCYADGRLISARIVREYSIPEYISAIKPIIAPPYVGSWEGPPLYSDNARQRAPL